MPPRKTTDSDEQPTSAAQPDASAASSDESTKPAQTAKAPNAIENAEARRTAALQRLQNRRKPAKHAPESDETTRGGLYINEAGHLVNADNVRVNAKGKPLTPKEIDQENQQLDKIDQEFYEQRARELASPPDQDADDLAQRGEEQVEI